MHLQYPYPAIKHINDPVGQLTSHVKEEITGKEKVVIGIIIVCVLVIMAPNTQTLFSFLFISQVSRCLKPGGRFVSVTFAQPFFRKRLYARTEYNWSIKHHSYVEGFEYFVYIMTKGEELSLEDAALERKLLEDTKSPPTTIVTTQNEDTEDFLCNIDL